MDTDTDTVANRKEMLHDIDRSLLKSIHQHRRNRKHRATLRQRCPNCDATDHSRNKPLATMLHQTTRSVM